MAAPILWAPGKNCVLSAGKPPCPKNSSFWGGGLWGFLGGECRFFLLARGFFWMKDFIWPSILGAFLQELGWSSRARLKAKHAGNWEISTTTTTTQRARKENLQSESLAPSTSTVDMEMLGKTSKTISTIAILWPVKAIFEKRAATVDVDTIISPEHELSKFGRMTK